MSIICTLQFKKFCSVDEVERSNCQWVGGTRLCCVVTLISSVNNCDTCQGRCDDDLSKCCFCHDVPGRTTTPPPPPPPPPPSSSGCFPSDAKVKLENGELLAMSKLEIGDRIQTGSEKHNLLVVWCVMCLDNYINTNLFQFEYDHIPQLFFYLFDIVSPLGTVSFSEVRTFLEREPDMKLKYKQIITSENRTLTLTRNHLVYVRSNSYDKFNPV